MHRTLIAGAILATLAAALIIAGDAFGLGSSQIALLGLAVGAVLGLVPSGAPPWRAGAWAVGLLVAWCGYAAGLLLLPDTSLGRAVGAAVVVLAVSVVAALSHGLLSLWASLLGVATTVAAYEATAAAHHADFWTDSTTAVTSVALAAGTGFLATSLMVRAVPVTEPDEPPQTDATVPGQRDGESDAGMGIVDWTRSEA